CLVQVGCSSCGFLAASSLLLVRLCGRNWARCFRKLAVNISISARRLVHSGRFCAAGRRFLRVFLAPLLFLLLPLLNICLAQLFLLEARLPGQLLLSPLRRVLRCCWCGRCLFSTIVGYVSVALHKISLAWQSCWRLADSGSLAL